jgi:hypothetical protein
MPNAQLAAFIFHIKVPAARKSLILVAREGIELATETLRFTAFHEPRQLSYPRCYPQLTLANRQLNRGPLVG